MERDPKRIDLAQADKWAARFARDHKRQIDDPIVNEVRRDLKMAFGLDSWRNRRAAEKRAMQPDLFPASPARVIEFHKPEEKTNE